MIGCGCGWTGHKGKMLMGRELCPDCLREGSRSECFTIYPQCPVCKNTEGNIIACVSGTQQSVVMLCSDCGTCYDNDPMEGICKYDRIPCSVPQENEDEEENNPCT